MRQIRYLSVTTVTEIVHLHLPRPGTHFPNVPVTHMYPTPKPRAFDVRSGAMEAPMPDLVTEPTELSCGTLFVTVVGVVCSALTAIVAGEPHLWAGPGLLGISACCYLVQRWSLHYMRGSGTTCTSPLTNLRTEFPET